MKYFKTVIMVVIILSLIVPAVIKKLTTPDPVSNWPKPDIFMIPTYRDNTPESFTFNLELPDLSTVSVEVTYSPASEMDLRKKTIIIYGLYQGMQDPTIKDKWFK